MEYHDVGSAVQSFSKIDDEYCMGTYKYYSSCMYAILYFMYDIDEISNGLWPGCACLSFHCCNLVKAFVVAGRRWWYTLQLYLYMIKYTLWTAFFFPWKVALWGHHRHTHARSMERKKKGKRKQAEAKQNEERGGVGVLAIGGGLWWSLSTLVASVRDEETAKGSS